MGTAGILRNEVLFVTFAGIAIVAAPAVAQQSVAAYRANAGGPAYTDPQDNTWTSDAGFFNTGSTYSVSGQDIANTELDTLYQTERWDPAAAPDMTYSFPVSAGTYLVRLHFAEIYTGAASVGARVFNVAVEGQVVLANFDIFAEVGLNAAVIKEFQVPVSDDSLDIQFTAQIENPKISAIEILSAPADLHANPLSLNFGTVTLPDSSAPQTLTLTNTGSTTRIVSAVAISGAQSADYATDAAPPYVLAASASVNFHVTFTPAVAGPSIASLTITSDDSTGDIVVPLSGAGTSPSSDPRVWIAAGTDPTAVFSGAMTTGTQYAAGTDNDPTLDNLVTPLVYANSTKNSLNGSNTDQVAYTVNLPAAGNWYLWARMYYPATGTGNSDANSFCAIVDNGPILKVGNKDFFQAWHWDGNGNLASSAPPAALSLGNLAAGTHTLIIRKREVTPIPPRLDVIVLTQDPQQVPTDAEAAVALGLAEPHPGLAVDPASLNFGSVTFPGASAQLTLALTNNGTAALNVTGLAIAGANATDFTTDATPPYTLTPFTSIDVHVTFTPGALGSRSASLTIASDSPAGDVVVPLSGTGIEPVVEPRIWIAAGTNPTALFKGAMTTGTQYTAGSDADPALNNLVTPLVYANSSGNSLSGSNTDQVEYTVTLPLSGTWYLWARMYYPATGTGSSDANSFCAIVDAGSILKVGNKDIFQRWHWDGNGNLASSASPAPLSLGNLAAGTHKLIVRKREVTPIPPRLDAIVLTQNASWVPTDAEAVAALGQPGPLLSVNPSTVDFGNVLVSTSSTPRQINLTNLGTEPMNVSAVSITGTQSADFSTDAAPPYVVEPSATVAITVTFTPSAVGAAGASLTIVSDNPSGDVVVSLTGSGTSTPLGETRVWVAAGIDPTAIFKGAMTTGTDYTGGADVDPTLDNLVTPLLYANSTTNALNGDSGDEVEYTVTLPETGTWYLWGRFYYPGAPGSNDANSFLVKVDNGSLLKLGNKKDAFQKWHWDGDGNQETGTPAKLTLGNLAAGAHKLVIQKREVVPVPPRLDLMVLTLDAGWIPTDADAATALGLSVAPSVLSWGHVPVGALGPTKNITLTNTGTSSVTVNTLSFLINKGVGHDFAVTVNGTEFEGDHADVSYPINLPIAAGASVIVPVVFRPTEEADNDVWLQFGGNFVASRARLQGTGGDSTGDPYLHVVLRVDPYIVDYDNSGSEVAALQGSESHTHEIGHTLAAFQWSESGTPFATTADTSKDFPMGNHTVTLTIWDDNVPPRTLSDSKSFKVVPPDGVPGSLVLYYESGEGGPAGLLDAPPAQANYAERLPALRVDDGGGTIGSSPYTGQVMVRVVGQIDVAQADQYTFQASGGTETRLFVDASPVSGPISLTQGRHNVEARFAIASLTELPLEVTMAQGSDAQGPVDPAIVTHSESAMGPVVNSVSPAQGPEVGGNQVILTGLGFFRVNQVIVHWGNQSLTGASLTVTPSSISLNAPPGQGLITVTVETPNGLSNGHLYNYTSSGPLPIQFALADVATVASPTQADWGQDGRLYVGSIGGTITAYTFDDNYSVTATQTIPTLTGLTNKNILGLTCNPFDAPGPVRIYVAHSQLFANGGSCFTGFSPYSGQISVLTGPSFDVAEPLITGLPVSNHDHAINGLQFDNNGDLLIAIGGNTNAGVEHCAMGGLPESPLTAAIVKALTSKSDFNGQIIYLLTSNGTANNDQVFGDVVDVAPGVDVSVFGAGLRNPWDLAFTTRGLLYATDNGPNLTFGGASTSATTEGPDPEDLDELNLIEAGGYYGHPNRNRGRTDDRQNVYHGSAALSIPGVFTQALTNFTPSTDGLAEYRANTFQGAMRGDLLAQKWDGTTYRITLSSDGRSVASKSVLPVSLGSLDVVPGPGGVLFGIDYSSNKVVIAKPVDPGATGVTVYDIFPWRAPAAGGVPFVIGGSGFGTPADTSVTIGGLPVQITSVSANRIRGVIPAHATPTTAMLDVVVTVGGASKLLPAAFRYLLPAGTEPVNDIWQIGTSMPVALGEVAAAYINGKVYVVGEGSTATLAYDVLTGTWTATLAVRPFPGNHHGCEVVNGKMYLFGGIGSGAGKVQIYDPVTNAWSLGADMPFAAGSPSSALINGEVYVCGGIVGSTTVNNLARYNPTTNSWVSLAPMPQARNHAASNTNGSKLYVFGGRGPGSGDGNVVANGFDTVEIYDPATNTWVSSQDSGSTLAPLPQARGGMGKAVYFNGEFFVMGGETQSGAGATALHVYNRVDIYNPVTNTWRLGAPMPTARHGIFPVLRNGTIYVPGGGIQAGLSQSAVNEIYTP